VNTIKYVIGAIALAVCYTATAQLCAAVPATTVLAQAEAKLKEIEALRTQQMPILQSILNMQQKRYEFDKKINQATAELNKFTKQLKDGSPERKAFTDKMKKSFVDYEASVKALKPTTN
jgi:uncharacterized protein YlxW (UPF0749 family)